jgi:iron(III) transport system permease protein
MRVAVAGQRMQKAGNLDTAAKLVLAVGAGAAIYLIAVPLAMLLVAAFRGPADYLPFEPGARWTLEHVRALLTDPVIYTRILPDTFIFVVGTVALVFVIALGLAWLVERTDLPGREIWFSLILFPLLVPTPVLAIAWIFLIGPNAGWLNLMLRAALGLEGAGPIDIFSMGGLILCQALASTPFVFLLLGATLRAMDPALEEASAASGASPLTTFRRVTLPVLLPGLLAPLVLITLITAEQFELPLIIGLPAKINVFSYRIYFELNPLSSLPNYGGAAALSLPFLALGVLLLLLYNRLIGRADSFVTMTGKGYRQRRLPLGIWRFPALALLGLYVALAAILPAAVLLWTSFFGYTVPLAATTADFSVEAYRQLFGNPAFWLGVRNTLLVALVSALIVTAVGMLLGWIISRSLTRFRHVLDFVSVLSVGIPAVIAGLGVMLFYLSLPIGLYGTVAILIIAYCYRFATTTRLARAGFLQIHKELEEASATSGARWLATLRRVLIPLMLPALAAGFVLLFIVGVREFTIPLVLYSQDNVVLSVLLWQLFQSGQPAPSAALASIIIAVVLPVIFVARRTLARRALAG